MKHRKSHSTEVSATRVGFSAATGYRIYQDPMLPSQKVAEGSVETTERDLSYAKKLLDAYEEPKFEADKDEALPEYVAHREREIPAEDALNQTF